jgi:queuine/archaeosine tRNA-ribosyltransferase
MTVLLITALQAAETLARFHQEQADKMPPGAVQGHQQDMARRCLADIEDIKGHLFAVGATVEHQADALRRHDLETAQRIIDRHVIMHGVGIHADDAPAARTAMARDIAEALLAARGGTAS